MSTPELTPSWASPDPPRPPWIPLRRTSVEQTATVVERLEAWLCGGELDTATECAHALLHGEDDPAGVAGWAGTRVEEAGSWS